jgi:helicase
MKMQELVRHDVPQEVIDQWEVQESEVLLPLQEMAVRKHDLFARGNLLLQAPTSSGKTFVGEMAALHTALRRKKVVYLVPLKALAEEKFLDFKEKYERYGLRVIISTRDHREFDGALESGDFSMAVVVYEKLAQLLVRRPERIQEIELVIADELEILSDPDRGSGVELLLTGVLRMGCRLIGMSAVIGYADKLAEWMGAALLAHDRRPVELRYGVLHDGIFRYRTYNEYAEEEEALVEADGESPWDIVAANVCAFAERGEPCLVFVKAKHEARRQAEVLADRLDGAAANDAIERLRHLEPTHMRDSLLHTLNNGVAFHTADLSPEERHVVETAFREGEVTVTVATSTLAVGMNLPAQNVFITADKWQYDDRFGMPWKAPISRAEYENMGGRAGRYGAHKAFGRSILVAPTPFDQETMWRRYVEGERECIQPRLGREPLEDHALRLVTSRACRSEEELQSFLESTLTGRWYWQESLTHEECAFRVRTAVNHAVDAGTMARHPAGGLEATPFGRVIAAKGITIATAQELAAWLGESETRLWSDLDPMIAAALTPDGRLLQVMLTAREYEQADYPGLLKERTAHEDLTTDVPLNRLRNCDLMPFFEEVRAIKASLILLDWIDHAPVYDLEEQFHTTAGQVLGAADQLSWLLDATAAIATAFGAQVACIARIEALAERIHHGVRTDLLPLAQANIPGLTRSQLIDLAAQDLEQPEALVDLPDTVLRPIVGPQQAHALKGWACRQMIDAPAIEAVTPPHAAPATLVVDDRRPGEIVLDGQTIFLQEKQYRLIRTLAKSPGECVSYDTIYQAVWEDSVVENNQMHFQKRKLLACINEAVPAYATLVTTIAKRGFVLNLRSDEVLLHTVDHSAVA